MSRNHKVLEICVILIHTRRIIDFGFFITITKWTIRQRAIDPIIREGGVKRRIVA